MKENGLANNHHSDERGSVIVELALVFPLLVLIILGIVDASMLMYDWGAATKATYRGARVAAVNNPVAASARFPISDYTTMLTKAGNYCFLTDGTVDTSAACPTVNITCKGAAGSGGSCDVGSFNDTSFTKIFDAVQSMYPFRLSRAQVQVQYQTTGTGFVGQPSFDGTSGELPMNVTVSLRCIKHQFYFVGGLMGWVFPDLAASCSDVTSDTAAVQTKGVTLPNFYTTLPSESLYTIP